MMKVWGITDVGLVRKENQDAFGIREATSTGHTICVVCDGMGGTVGGSLASSVAVESFLQEMEAVLRPDMSPEQLREVMYLRVMSDLSYREIGEIMGKSENWARVTFYRAKEALLKGRDRNE